MTMKTGKDIEKAAELILPVWGEPTKPLSNLPDDLQPGNLAHAYGIQQAVSRGLGAIGGWVICTQNPAAGLTCAPIPLASIRLGPSYIPTERWTFGRVEAKICFRMGGCLPDYDAPYARERVVAAIESCHPAVEVRQPRFADPDSLDPLTALADSYGFGCLVCGQHGSSWQNLDLLCGQVRAFIDGKEMPAQIMAPDSDVIGTLQWLANEGAGWAGGLMVGQLVTIGTGTGEIPIPAGPRTRIVVGGLGEVGVQFICDRPGRAPPDRRHRALWPRWLRGTRG